MVIHLGEDRVESRESAPQFMTQCAFFTASGQVFVEMGRDSVKGHSVCVLVVYKGWRDDSASVFCEQA